jgi:hypothetical protein
MPDTHEQNRPSWNAVDYVGRSGEGLTPMGRAEGVKEYPYSNGCQLFEGMVALPGRRYAWPKNVASMPLMLGIRASRPKPTATSESR